MQNIFADPMQDKMSYSENKEVNSNMKAVPKQGTSTTEDPIQRSTTPPKDEALGHQNPTGEVNMEAAITSEDIIRAGGFGARDDLSSFLPIASDATDFEETLLDARDYEEPQPEVPRPGLGWKDPKGAY